MDKKNGFFQIFRRKKEEEEEKIIPRHKIRTDKNKKK